MERRPSDGARKHKTLEKSARARCIYCEQFRVCRWKRNGKIPAIKENQAGAHTAEGKEKSCLVVRFEEGKKIVCEEIGGSLP